MALEAINEIKKAETEAENRILEAMTKAKEIVNSANEEAENEYNKILDEANNKKFQLISKAEEEGKAQAEPVLKAGEGDVLNIKNISNEKKDNAINLIVERIVKIHGNS